MGQSDRTETAAVEHARQIRNALIDLSYELPKEPSKAILDAWTEADMALFKLINHLENW